MVRVFERGLTEPTGYVLPIQKWNAPATAPRWMTEMWTTRRGKLFLAAGDAPVGYRLPLGSLPHVPETSFPHVIPLDPTIPRNYLPPRDEILRERELPKAHVTADETNQQTRIGQTISDIEGVVRTALTVEPRDGRLNVFMPPTERLEDYLELAAAAEAAAEKLGLSVHIEGYAPPPDPRLNVIRRTFRIYGLLWLARHCADLPLSP